MKTSQSLWRLYLLTLICACLITACGVDITVPDADDTLPSILFHVHISDEDEIEITSVGDPVERIVSAEDTITFTAVARDADGGTRYVRIFARVFVACMEEDHLSGVLHILNPDNPSDAKPGDRTTIERSTSLTISIQQFLDDCPEGSEYLGLEGDIQALAVNFHSGGTFSAPFLFTHPDTYERASEARVDRRGQGGSPKP